MEWNDQYARYQVLTDKVYAPCTDKAGRRMQRYGRVACGMAEEEQAEMDSMIAKCNELCASAEKRQQQRQRRAAAESESPVKRKRHG